MNGRGRNRDVFVSFRLLQTKTNRAVGNLIEYHHATPSLKMAERIGRKWISPLSPSKKFSCELCGLYSARTSLLQNWSCCDPLLLLTKPWSFNTWRGNTVVDGVTSTIMYFGWGNIIFAIYVSDFLSYCQGMGLFVNTCSIISGCINIEGETMFSWSLTGQFRMQN